MFCVRRGKFLRCRESQLKWQSQIKEFPETLNERRFDNPFSISFPSVVNLLLFSDLKYQIMNQFKFLFFFCFKESYYYFFLIINICSLLKILLERKKNIQFS